MAWEMIGTLALATLLAVVPLGVFGALAAGYYRSRAPDTPRATHMIALMELSFLLVAAAFLLAAGGHALGLAWPSALGVALALGYLPFNYVTSTLLSRASDALDAPEADVGEWGAESTAGLVAVSLLLIGPAEELLYRGVVQALWVGEVGTVAGIIAASALFGVVHFPSYGAESVGDVDAGVALGMGGTAVAGAYLGASYVATGTLLVPVVGHSLYDAVLFWWLVRR